MEKPEKTKSKPEAAPLSGEGGERNCPTCQTPLVRQEIKLPATYYADWCTNCKVWNSSGSPAVAAQGQKDAPGPTEMYVCEISHLILHAGQTYRFSVHPDCQGCKDYFGVGGSPARSVEDAKNWWLAGNGRGLNIFEFAAAFAATGSLPETWSDYMQKHGREEYGISESGSLPSPAPPPYQGSIVNQSEALSEIWESPGPSLPSEETRATEDKL